MWHARRRVRRVRSDPHDARERPAAGARAAVERAARLDDGREGGAEDGDGALEAAGARRGLVEAIDRVVPRHVEAARVAVRAGGHTLREVGMANSFTNRRTKQREREGERRREKESDEKRRKEKER